MNKTVFAYFTILCLLSTVFLVRLSSRIQPVKASGTIHIRVDGSVDPPTAPIQRNGDVYNLTGNITSDTDGIVIERNNMTLDGAGYTVLGPQPPIPGPVGPVGINLTYRSNVTIRNIGVGAFYSGIYLFNSLNSSMVGNNITNNVEGICLEFSSNSSMVGNNITTNGYAGIRIQSSSNNNVSGNNIIRNHYAGVELRLASNNGVVGNSITNNGIGTVLDGSSNNSIVGNMFAGDGLLVLDSCENKVENNIVNGKPLVYLEGRSDYTVDDAGQAILLNCNNIRLENLDLSNTTVGLELSGTNNSRIVNNNIFGDEITTSYHIGIWLFHSSNNSMIGNNVATKSSGICLERDSLNNNIVGNNITGNDEGITLNMASNYNNIAGNNVTNNGLGISLSNSYYNSILGNSISGTNGSGVRLYVCHNNHISGNNITANNWSGISLVLSLDNNISGNNITNNKYGLYVYSGGYHVTSGNNITNNEYGIWIDWTTQPRTGDHPVTITGNNITSNGYGIILYSSSSIIYHNNFINNTVQANSSDLYIHNVWDNGYPSGGNYWSDYEDRYPDAEEIDVSGIWDRPYVIDENNQDNYPLMEVIPEFPALLILPLFMTATLLVVIAYKMRNPRKEPETR